MASLLAQIAWLRFDGLCGSLVGLLSVIQTAAAFDSSNSPDNSLGLLAHELNSFVNLGTDGHTSLSLLTSSLPCF